MSSVLGGLVSHGTHSSLQLEYRAGKLCGAAVARDLALTTYKRGEGRKSVQESGMALFFLI